MNYFLLGHWTSLSAIEGCKDNKLVFGVLVHFKVDESYQLPCSQGVDLTVAFKSDKVFLNQSWHVFTVIVQPVVLHSMTTGRSRISLLLSTGSFVRPDPNNTRPVIQRLRYEIASRWQGIYRWENSAEQCQHLCHGIAVHHKQGRLHGTHGEYPQPYVGTASNNRCRSTAEHMHNNYCINDE